jgi:hypothetical protein
VAADYDNARLGGPPGLYDSPNWDRESTGGIVQRVRVPAQATPPQPEQMFSMGVLSLNDSDNKLDYDGEKPMATSSASGSMPDIDTSLKTGIVFRKPIFGSNM